jgi:uncharacterized membrane protein
MMRVRPQILAAIVAITVIAVVVVLFTPQYVDKVAASAITGIGMLGMKLLEGE